MNNAFLLVLGVFTAFGGAWYGMVLQPYRQLAAQQEVKIVGTEQRYPAPRGGLAERGAEVYRQEGCYYCHSQQVRATGYAFNLHVEPLNPAAPGPEAEALTNQVVKLIQDVANLDAKTAVLSVRTAPKRILSAVSEAKVAAVRKSFAAIGAEKALGVELVPTGSDLERGWGLRQTVLQDYLHDGVIMPGSVRHGPDLANIGVRKPQAQWHLAHLYAPVSVAPESKMPPYRHLFRIQPAGRQPAPGSLRLGPEFGAAQGYELIPTEDARALAAYLLSLQSQANLFEARSPKLESDDGGDNEGRE